MSEEPVTVSETEIKEIAKEIEAVDDKKLASVKKETLDEVAKLRQELEAEKIRLAELEKAAEVEHLQEELKRVKAEAATKATTKAIISENVTNPAKSTVTDVPVLTHEEAWQVLGQSVNSGRWSGTFTK